MTKRLTKGIRADKLRVMAAAAVEQGWTARVDGNGHLCLTSPDGSRFWISMTVRGSMGRNYENTKAKARKAGLDVTNL